MKTILLSILTLITASSFGQNIFKDNLSTYNTGVQLSGQGTWTNNSSNGGLGACAGAICSNANVLNQTVNYLNYGTSSKSFQLLQGTDGCGTLFPAVTTGDIYVAFILNISSTVTSPNDFFRVCSGSAFNTSFRLYAKDAGGATFTLGFAKGANATIYGSALFNNNQDHLVVLKYSQFSGSNDDILSLFVDPVFLNGEPATPTLMTAAGTDQSGNIDRLAFRQGTTNTPTGWVGVVSVSKSWNTLVLSNTSFTKEIFTITSNQAQNGVLNIKSNVYLNNVTLNIYDVQGRSIDTKKIPLNESLNDVTINPIKNAGVYIIEIISEDYQRFTQKIIVNN